VITIDVKRTLALIEASISSPTPEKLAALEVAAIRVQSCVFLHDVDITSV